MAVHDFADNQTLNPPTNDNATEVENSYQVCQKTGFKVSVSEGLVKQWDGLYTRRESFDHRHPQDRVRSVPERGRKGSPSPEPPDVFIELPVTELTPGVVNLTNIPSSVAGGEEFEVTISRDSGERGAATVQYTVANATPSVGEFTWADGVSGSQSSTHTADIVEIPTLSGINITSSSVPIGTSFAIYTITSEEGILFTLESGDTLIFEDGDIFTLHE